MTAKEKRIYQLIDSRQVGGIETHVLELASGLQLFGWSVEVIFMNDYGVHPLKDALAERLIPFTCLDGSFSTLWRFLAATKPELVHTHGYKAGIFGRLAGLAQSIPIVSTFHAGEKTRGKLAFYSFLDRLTAPLSRPIAVSEAIAARLKCKSECINNFVSVPVCHRSHGNMKVAFVGRLSEEKGPDIFCELAQKNPELEFHIYGDGPMGKHLRERYQGLVTFHGRVDMTQNWQDVDLLCMPSRFEGLPMAALEAMARAIPVLASKAGNLPSLIEDTKNGWTIPVSDQAGFTDVLSHWRKMTVKKRLALGLNARSKIKAEYSVFAVIPQMEEIYLNTIADMKRGASS